MLEGKYCRCVAGWEEVVCWKLGEGTGFWSCGCHASVVSEGRGVVSPM